MKAGLVRHVFILPQSYNSISLKLSLQIFLPQIFFLEEIPTTVGTMHTLYLSIAANAESFSTFI